MLYDKFEKEIDKTKISNYDNNYIANKLFKFEDFTESEWLDFKTNGYPNTDYTIGGNEIGKVLNISPYESRYMLYKKKKGEKFEENKKFTKAGLEFESSIANCYRNFEILKDATIEEDLYIYQHPINTFMIAKTDRILTYPNGNKAILEIKLTSPFSEKVKDYKEGIAPLEYEAQVRWYMAVKNINKAYILCAWGFFENDMVLIEVNRDLKIENFLINNAKEFLADLRQNKEPDLKGVDFKLALKELELVFNRKLKTDEIYTADEDKIKKSISKIYSLKTKLSDITTSYNAKKKKYEAKIENELVNIISKAENKCYFETFDEELGPIMLSYLPTSQGEKVNKEKMLALYDEKKISLQELFSCIKDFDKKLIYNLNENVNKEELIDKSKNRALKIVKNKK